MLRCSLAESLEVMVLISMTSALDQRLRLRLHHWTMASATSETAALVLLLGQHLLLRRTLVTLATLATVRPLHLHRQRQQQQTSATSALLKHTMLHCSLAEVATLASVPLTMDQLRHQHLV